MRQMTKMTHCASCSCKSTWTEFEANQGAWLWIRISSDGVNVETYSLDGKNAAWAKSKETLPEPKPDAQGIIPLVCGLKHKQQWGTTGYDTPGHWCRSAYKYLTNRDPPVEKASTPAPPTPAPPTPAPPTPAPPGGWTGPVNYLAKRSVSARDYRVVIMNDAKEVQSVPEPQFPDGVSCIAPSADGKQFILVLPEQTNYMCKSTSPFYEDQPKEAWKPINSLGSWNTPLPWPSSQHAGAVWLFGLFKSPSRPGMYIGLSHGENHKAFTAPPCWKSLLVSYSYDECKTWTLPQSIIQYPKYTPQYENVWSGAGDPGFVYDPTTGYWYAYFFSAQGGMGIARSTDPECKPGSWKFYLNGGFNSDALTGGSYTPIPGMAGGNPCVLWSTVLNKWVMMVSEWSANNYLTFATSDDLLQWSNIKRVPFVNKTQVPLYPSIVSREYGTYAINRDGRIYYCEWNNGDRRKMMVRSIQILAA